MPLINCKDGLELKWTKYCVFPAAGADNVNGNDDYDNIIFTIKDKKLYVPVVTLSARVNQINIQVLNYLPKGIIESYNVIINGIKFYDQAIDSDVKKYEEIRI